MKDYKKSAVYDDDSLKWIESIRKKEGFKTFSQTVRWIMKKAKEAGIGGGK